MLNLLIQIDLNLASLMIFAGFLEVLLKPFTCVIQGANSPSELERS